VVAAHPLGRGLQGIALGGGNGVERRLEIGLREFQRRHGLCRQAVEAGRVVEHGGIAARLHIGQDVGHALLDGCIRVGGPMQAIAEGGFEIGAVGAQAYGLGLHGFRVSVAV